MLKLLMAKRKILSDYQRDKFADGLIEWGNLVFTGLVVAQFVPGTYPFRKGIFLTGLFAYIVANILAYFLTLGGEFDD